MSVAKHHSVRSNEISVTKRSKTLGLLKYICKKKQTVRYVEISVKKKQSVSYS